MYLDDWAELAWALAVVLIGLICFAVGLRIGTTYERVRDPERLWEGSAEWVAVNAIEEENILLKKKLDDQQVHYDSLVCFRP